MSEPPFSSELAQAKLSLHVRSPYVPSSIPEAGSWSNLILEARTGSESLCCSTDQPGILGKLPTWLGLSLLPVQWVRLTPISWWETKTFRTRKILSPFFFFPLMDTSYCNSNGGGESTLKSAVETEDIILMMIMFPPGSHRAKNHFP